MKLSEAIKHYCEGSRIQWLEKDMSMYQVWMDVEDFMTLAFLKRQTFRIRPYIKEKVKRYQVLYSAPYPAKKGFYVTEAESHKYKNKEDFDSYDINAHRTFISLIKESEEEFDE